MLQFSTLEDKLYHISKNSKGIKKGFDFDDWFDFFYFNEIITDRLN